jgi:hypothetical protein
MITIVLLLAAGALVTAAQELDLSFLKPLEKDAKESTEITIGKEQMQIFKSFLGGKEGGEFNALTAGLEMIQIKTLEFDRAGVYSIADMENLKSKVKASGVQSMVSVKEKGGFTEVMVRQGPNGTNRGFVILVAEPKEVTVVNIIGNIDLASLGQLSGKMGIPHVQLGNSGPPKGSTKKGKEPQEEEEEF